VHRGASSGLRSGFQAHSLNTMARPTQPRVLKVSRGRRVSTRKDVAVGIQRPRRKPRLASPLRGPARIVTDWNVAHSFCFVPGVTLM
jgi:hypothetical protein